MSRLTKRTIDSLESRRKDYIIWDSGMPGYGMRVSPSGRRSFVVQYKNSSGRSRRLTMGQYGVLTPSEAREMAHQYLAAARRGKDPAEQRREELNADSMANLAEKYMTVHAIPNKKPRSVTEDRAMIDRFIIPRFGHLRVAGLSKPDVLRLRADLSETPVQFNRVLSLLRAMMNLAEGWGLREPHSNPCYLVKKYPEKPRAPELTAPQLIRLGAALREADGVENPSGLLAIRLAILTGMRKSEVLNLRWDEIDFDGRCLRLPDSKTGDRTIRLGKPAVDLLASADGIEDNPFVCPGRVPGKHLIGLQKIWERVRSSAGLEHLRLHDLRHVFATTGAGAGESLTILGRLLGHSSPSMTARYADVLADPAQEAAERISGTIAGFLDGEHENVVAIRGHR